MIPEFISAWEQGYKIVLAVKPMSRTNPLIHGLRKLYYRMLDGISGVAIVKDATGFGLYDRVVVDTVARWREPEPFFRGMVVESGYRLAVLPFDRPPRRAGNTKNDASSLAAFALSGLSGSARSLLRLPILLSLWTGALTLLLTTGLVVALVLGRASWPLFLILAVQLATFTVLLLFLGLFGDQLRLVAERTRGTPLVIEEERINFPPGRRSPRVPG